MASHFDASAVRLKKIILHLGERSGAYDFLTWKENQPAFFNIPVVIVSSEPVSKPDGAIAFIRKPFTFDEMLETFHAHS